jgi:hypothetical protein
VHPEGTSRKGNRRRRVAPLEHLVCPEGNFALLTNKLINLDGLRMNFVIRKF